MSLLYLWNAENISFNSRTNWTCSQSMKLRLFFSQMKNCPLHLPVNVPTVATKMRDMCTDQLLCMHRVAVSVTSLWVEFQHSTEITIEITWNIHVYQHNRWSLFTARALLSRYMPWSCVCPSVRLSVCLSVTSRCSTKMAKRRNTQTTPHDSPGTLVFWCQKSFRNSNGVTPNGGAKWRWGRVKSANFDK